MSHFDVDTNRRIVIPLLILLIIIWSYKLGDPTLKVPSSFIPVNQESPNNLSHLSKIQLSSSFTYARRTIRTEHFNGERPDMTVVNRTLFPEAQRLDLSDLEDVEIPSLPPLTLRIPSTPQVDTSIFSFGIATHVSRLPTALEQLAHWLPVSGCPLHVLAPPADNPPLPEVQKAFEAHAINLTVVNSTLDFPIAYFSLVKLLYETRLPSTKWLVLIDDDTFVPSLPSLVGYFERNYDASKEMLISAATEDMHQVNAWGLIPYGGGGIFISVPLAAHLTRPEIWNICITGMGHNQGDGILSHCLFQYTSIRPTFSLMLNQMDFRGNAIGMFESGRRMLTIHHWRSWFQVNMPKAAVVSKACGNEGILQRWVFPQHNMVLNNGYTINMYNGGVESIAFEAVEKTWEGEAERFIHHIGPLRPGLYAEEKFTYGLELAEDVEGLGVRQVYVKKGSRQENSTEEDSVLELIWLY